MNMKMRVATVAAVFAFALAFSSNAHALSISDPNVVGTVEDAVPFGDAERLLYTNTLLGLDAPAGPVTIPAVGGETYTKVQDLGSGSVTSTGSLSGTGSTTVSGYEYVLVKYDGPNAGAVLFYLGGASFVLPSTSDQLFPNGSCGANCGISGWTAYNPMSVPDGGSTVTLLGSVLLGLGMLRRRFSTN
jgi:hypothetical protein